MDIPLPENGHIRFKTGFGIEFGDLWCYSFFCALRRWDRRVLIPYFIARETRNQQILLSEHDAPKRAISWLAYFKSYE